MSLRIEEHVFRVLDRQIRMFDRLGEHDWGLEIDQGLIRFTSAETGQGILDSPIQVLGTESVSSGTWLWAWANTGSSLPPPLLQAANRLRVDAEREGDARFTQPQLAVQDPALGTELSMIAVGHLGLPAHYVCPYDGGAAYVALVRFDGLDGPPDNALAALETIQASVANVEFDHREALHHYLGQPAAQQGRKLIWNVRGADLIITLDRHGRIVELATTYEG
jgi:hypothetical protein